MRERAAGLLKQHDPGCTSSKARKAVAKFPMPALLAGILLTLAMAIFGTWNTWTTYESFRKMANVELRLDRLSGTIVHLDEVLTMSARMCAVTGDPQWEARYRHFEPVLDAAIKEVIAIAPEETVRLSGTQVDVANIRLVEMEHSSFDLVREGRQADAKRLLFSPEYEEQKAIYAQGITETKEAIQGRVDEEIRRHGRRALAGLGLTLAALLALTLGWARVVALVRSSVKERLSLQGQLEDAVRARDEFLSIASHELKTPLTALQLLVDGLTAAGQRTPPISDDAQLQQKKLTVVQRQVHRLSVLVDELLDTSRITSGRMVLTLKDDVDLSQIVAESVTRFKDALARASCEIQIRGVDVPILGRWDRLRLEQVVSNLLSNAIKYGAGKPIEVDAEATESAASICVRDHGIGIMPAKQALIFERFERAVSERQYGGFGLGLWIVRQIATAMHGEVSVISRPGEGAAFRVVLPRRAL